MWTGMFIKDSVDSNNLANLIVQYLTEMDSHGTVNDLHFFAREGGIYVIHQFKKNNPELGKITINAPDRTSHQGVSGAREDIEETGEHGLLAGTQTFDGHRW